MASANVNIVFPMLLMIVLIAQTYSKEESLLDTQISDNESLLINIMKRLGISNIADLQRELTEEETDNKQPSSSSSTTVIKNKASADPILSKTNKLKTEKLVCQASNIKQDTIIRASESINAGAKFIDSYKDTASNAACIEMCCSNTSCDVSVYQDKVS